MQYLFLLLLLITSCKPDPATYMEKAKNSLNQENTLEAIMYFEKAYETSLEEHFFIHKNREQEYSFLSLSENKKVLLLVDKEKDRFIITDTESKDIISKNKFIKITGAILSISLSPAGLYATFVVQPNINKEECFIHIYDLTQTKFHDKTPPTYCDDRVGILDSGILLYRQAESIFFIDIKQNTEPALWTNRQLEKRLKNFLEKANIVIAHNNIPYITYGEGGIYTLYNLSNKSLLKLSVHLATGEIFFKPNSIIPGVLIGGSGLYQIAFYNPNFLERVVERYAVGIWRNIAFVSNTVFYYMSSSRIYKYDITLKKEQSLPFLAKDIATNTNGDLFFLSLIGTGMCYRSEVLNSLSLKIFNKTLDLNLGK